MSNSIVGAFLQLLASHLTVASLTPCDDTLGRRRRSWCSLVLKHALKRLSTHWPNGSVVRERVQGTFRVLDEREVNAPHSHLMNVVVNSFIHGFMNGAFSQVNFVRECARFPENTS